MPPVIILMIGTVGIIAAAKWIASESARINAELHPEPRDLVTDAQAREGVGRLKRDKATGVFRPDKV